MGQGRGHEDHGASAVEFAIVLPILIILVFGIIEFGLAFNRMQAFQASAREAARLVSVGVDENVVRDRVEEVMAGAVAPSEISYDEFVECDGGQEFGRITISIAPSARSGYAIRIPLLGELASPDHSTTAAFRCESPPQSAL